MVGQNTASDGSAAVWPVAAQIVSYAANIKSPGELRPRDTDGLRVIMLPSLAQRRPS